MSQQTTVQPENVLRTPLGYLIEIDIDSDITSPREWKEEIRAIRTASPFDTLHFRLVSNGGRLDTTSEMISALQQTEAKKVMEITGPIASAATMIFLQGDEFILNEGSEMMIHQASGGAINGMRQLTDHVNHMSRQCEKLVRDTYKDFCSEEEIEDILKGVEIWLDAEEISNRLESRAKCLEEETLALVEEYTAKDRSYLEALDKDTLIGILMGDDELELPEFNEAKINDQDEVPEDLKFFGDFYLEKLTGDIYIPLGKPYRVYWYEMDEIDNLKLAKKFADEVGIKYNKNASTKQMVNLLSAWVGKELVKQEGE